MQKDAYQSFVDDTKVKSERSIWLVGKLDLFRRDISIIHNLYWEQAACIQTENDLQKYKSTEGK